LRSAILSRFDPGAFGRALTPQRRDLAYTPAWAATAEAAEALAAGSAADCAT